MVAEACKVGIFVIARLIWGFIVIFEVLQKMDDDIRIDRMANSRTIYLYKVSYEISRYPHSGHVPN